MSQIDSKQLKSGDLRAIAAIPDGDTGLIRKTGPGAATVVPIGATALGAMGGDAAAWRGAIDAEVAFTQGAIIRPTLTGSGLERRASDGSVWHNGVLVQTPNLSLSQQAAAGRSLVYNPCSLPAVLDQNGVLKAQNWSAFDVDTANRPGAGLYSLSGEGKLGHLYCDELFDITPGVTYGVYISAKIVGEVPAGAAIWPNLAMFSAAGLEVNTRNSNYLEGTATRLSRAISNGDASVYLQKDMTLTSISGFTGVYTALAIYGSQGYLSPEGIQYEAPHSGSPLGFYTRWVNRLGAGVGATATDLGSEWKVDFAAGYTWASGSFPVGTLCGATNDSDVNTKWLAVGTPGSAGVTYPFPVNNGWANLAPSIGTTHWRFDSKLRAGANRFKLGVYQPAAYNARYTFGIYEVL